MNNNLVLFLMAGWGVRWGVGWGVGGVLGGVFE